MALFRNAMLSSTHRAALHAASPRCCVKRLLAAVLHMRGADACRSCDEGRLRADDATALNPHMPAPHIMCPMVLHFYCSRSLASRTPSAISLHLPATTRKPPWQP